MHGSLNLKTEQTVISQAMVLAAVVALALVQLAAFWPGIIVWDSIVQYGQALSGRFDDWHPPLMAWLWRQLQPIHSGPLTLLCLQVILYWGGIGMLALWASRAGRRWLSVLIVMSGLLPLPFAQIGIIIKDSLMAGALLCACGILALGQDRLKWWAGSVAILLLLFAAAIRFNAFAACLPILVALLPSSWTLGRARLGLAAGLGLIVLMAMLPLANRMLHAQRSGVEMSLLIYDIGGITEYSEEDAFPPIGYNDALTINDNCYSTASWDTYAWWTEQPCPLSFDKIRAYFRTSGENPYKFWLNTVEHYPAAYAEHRLMHFNTNMRFLVHWYDYEDVTPPVQEQADTNPWNYKLSPNSLRSAIVRAALWSADTPLGWPICWTALSVGGLILASRLPSRLIIVPIALSSVLYALTYLPMSVASEMRYHLWTMTAGLIVTVIVAADLTHRPNLPWWRLSLAAAPFVIVTGLAVTWRMTGAPA